MNYLVLVSCLGLATSTLSSCCACFQSSVEFLPPDLEAPAKAERSCKFELDVGAESLSGIAVCLGPGIFLQNL